MKRLNIFKWFEFKKESVIVFANLKRNQKAYQCLDEYAKAIWIFAYMCGMLVYALVAELIEFLKTVW